MAQKVQVTLTDDLDGKPADETVIFGLDGITYEVDLSTKNAAAFRNSLAKYVGVARKQSRAGKGPARARSMRSGPNPRDVRDWAVKNKIDVPTRGRIPGEVIEKYQAANAG